MRSALRILARLASWVLVVVGALALALFGIVLVSAEGSDQRIGSVVLMGAAALVLIGGIWGLRRTPRLWQAEEGASPDGLAEARARLHAGEPIVLRPSRRRWSVLLVLSVVLAAASALAFIAAPNVIAGAGLVLFGAGVVVATLQLIPGRAYLGIAPDGLVVRTGLKTTHWEWNDIEHFRAYEVHHQYGSVKQVGFDRRDLTPERQGLWKTISRGMSGVDVALPDTYGLPHDGLAELLGDARDRYATEHGLSASARADRELEAQAARVRQDRVPAVTAALALACVVVFVSEATRFGLFPSAEELLDAGGTSRDALSDGRWWSLLTANAVHANPIHLLLNLTGLALLGTLLERELGPPRFALVCLVSGAAAMGFAVLLQPGPVVVGVSGVIFAVAGWAVLRDVHRTRALGTVAWSMLPVGIVYTFLAPRVSIGAHVGGLLAGLALGYAFERRPAERRRSALGV
jgi:membrane associated rhomboid family serine protease